MPTIPRYDGPQLQQQGIPDARQTTLSGATPDGAFGEALARGLGNVGVVLQKAQDDADKVRVFEARNKLQNAVNDSLYGKDGVFNRKGKNAANAATQWETDFDKVSQEIGTGLTARQREMYEQAAAEIRTPHRKQVLNYETDQWRAVEDQVYDATAATSLDTIAKNFNNPSIIENSIAVGDGALIRKYQQAGVDASVSELGRAQWASEAHATVVKSAMAAGNLKYAKAYFEKHGDLLKDNLRLVAELNAESDKVQGINTAMSLYQKYGAAEDLDVEGMMNEARATLKSQPDALAVAEREIKSMVAERDISRRRVQDDALDEVTNAIVGVRSRGRVPSIKDVPTKAFLAMDAEKKNSVLNLIETLQDRAQRDAKEARSEAEKAQEKRQGMQAAARFYQLVSDPNELKNKNLLSEASTFLGTSDGERYFGQLITAQKDLRKGKEDALTQIQGPADKVNGYLKQLGVKPDSEEGLNAKSTMQQKLTAFETRKGGKATPEEIDKLARDMFLKREVEVTGWNINKAPFQMTDKDIGRIRSIDNVPDSARNEIAADHLAIFVDDMAQRLGRQPTHAEIAAQYRAPSPDEITAIYRQSIQQAR